MTAQQREYEWRITELETKIQAASGRAYRLDRAFSEAYHYAMQYDQDGPIRVEIVRPR